MKPQTRHLALVAGIFTLTGVALLVACSDDAMVAIPDGGFGNPDATQSSSTSSTSSTTSSSGSSGNPQGDDDDTTQDAGGADCSAAPFVPKTTQGFYCAFFHDGGADAPNSSSCANDETCCQPGKVTGTSNYGTSFCAQSASKGDVGQTTCSNGAQNYTGEQWYASGSTTWECLSPSNCGSGQKCCAFSQDGTDGGIYVAKDTSATAAPAACNPHYVSKIGGSKCADDCAPSGEIELCSSNDPCSDTSKKCVAASTTGGKNIGACESSTFK